MTKKVRSRGLVHILQSVLICFRFNSKKQVGILGIWIFYFILCQGQAWILGYQRVPSHVPSYFLKASPLSQPRYIYRLVK